MFKVHREIEVYHQCQQSHNILHMVEFFEDDNTFYLVFELIRGGKLLPGFRSRGATESHPA